jgi:hypothetical protein
LKGDGEPTDEAEGEVVRLKKLGDMTDANLFHDRRLLFTTFFPSCIALDPPVSYTLVSFSRSSSV